MELVSAEAIDWQVANQTYMIGNATATTNLLRRGELCASFNGVRALLEYVRDEMPTAKQARHSEGNLGTGFHSFRSFTEALETYLYHPAAIKEFEECDTRLEGHDASGMESRYDTTGDVLDIGRFVEGEPEHFATMEGGLPNYQRANVVMNLSWPGRTNRKTINNCSRRIQRLVDWLENQRVRTAVLGFASSGTVHVEVRVKSHDEQLDVNDIAVVAHGDFLRRVMFRMCEYSETWRSDYGDATVSKRYLAEHAVSPHRNNEINVVVNWCENGRNIDKEFDALEQRLQETIAEMPADPKDRYKAILE